MACKGDSVGIISSIKNVYVHFLGMGGKEVVEHYQPDTLTKNFSRCLRTVLFKEILKENYYLFFFSPFLLTIVETDFLTDPITDFLITKYPVY